MPATHVALIRGINVGGKNPVPMAVLRQALTDRGLGGVQTYIQSGNVLVDAPELTSDEVSSLVELALQESCGVTTPVMTVTAATIRAVVSHAPAEYLAGADAFHRDVVFLHSALPMERAWSVVRLRGGVDEAWQGDQVIYFRRLSAERTKSKLTAIIGTPEYQQMTIRNWRTTQTLCALADN